MFRTIASAALVLTALSPSAPANAQGPQGATVECRSRNFQYDECFAGPLSQPQLIYQISGSPCILNKSWGFNPKSRYLWVAQGCSGVFADVGGYHYGRGDGHDPNARMYNQHGHDTGAVVAGAVLGAILSGIADGKHQHSTSNYHDNGGYNGCHGAGCLVDDPDTASQQIDTTPQFDKDGNPNFDTQGNYQGCHGVGCLVDNPDSPN